MIAFANPWAWLGALALVLPIAVHLLRRHRATRRPFPTLRFLPDARVVAVRRHRPTDVPLMLIRLAVVAAAVIALAQPLWRNAAAARAAASGLSRAVVVDRSPRMAQPSDDGRPGAERAAAEIGRLSVATNQVGVDAIDIRAGTRGRDWLGRASNRRSRDCRHLELRGRQRERRGRGGRAVRRRSQVDSGSAQPQRAVRWPAARRARRSRRVAERDAALDACAGSNRGVVGDRSRWRPQRQSTGGSVQKTPRDWRRPPARRWMSVRRLAQPIARSWSCCPALPIAHRSRRARRRSTRRGCSTSCARSAKTDC